METTPHKILQTGFGYHEFREHQQEIIEQVLAGNDVFVLMPTGSGKSICYQIPAIIRPGVGLIVSPLIALMQDQVSALRQNGIKAEYLNSSLSFQEARRVETRVLSGEADILYVAPERLLSEPFQAFLKKFQISLFAIDEAHCVSQWGHDFRPEYLAITGVTSQFPGVPRLALTATADTHTRREILEKLDLNDAARFVSSFDRPEIEYRVTLKNNEKKQLYEFISKEHPGDSGIVYVRTRKRADSMASWLRQKGVNALPYHAGLAANIRAEHQKRFLREDGMVMTATVAFGMGIDKPDVRFVAHLDLPASMEAYYQETGRAGRDGGSSDAWMVYSLSDLVAMRKLQDTSDAAESFKRIQRQKLESLLGYCETVACRRTVLLGYFSETYPAPCNACDNCNQKIETWDGTVAAQKALSSVYRTGQRFGAAYLTDVLMGQSNSRIERLGHDRIKTFGVGRELSKTEWRSVFRQLLAAGFLTVNLAEISGFRLTEKSRPVLNGKEPIRLRKDPLPVLKKKVRGPSFKHEPDVNITGEKPNRLWENLRRLRLDISREHGIPPFVVFHDRTLKEMVVLRPKTRNELLGITGVGEKKADRYGDLFLSVIQEAER
jgi:ATP-dependent DNA helicase RecQ